MSDDLEARLRAAPTVDPAAALARFHGVAEGAALVDIAFAKVDSPVGELVLAATDDGLLALGWGESVLELAAERVSPRIIEAGRQLDEYFDGRRRTFDVPLDFALSNGFRRDVLRALASGVGYGEVVTYGELATRVGNPRASRAVGSAMASNPIAIVVPCHRVVRAGGALGNYSGRDGIVTKQFLLDLEGGRPRMC